MKISEYTLLEDAFHEAFGFMLNRIWEIYDLPGDPHERVHPSKRDQAEDRCFNEFMIALEEIGVELGEVEAPLKCK